VTRPTRATGRTRPTASSDEPVELREDSPEGRAYRAFHERRYEFLVAIVRDLGPGSVLVVGPSFETALLRERLAGATVDTLGIYDSGFSPREGERHIEFDLNDSVEPDRWPSPEPYDVVVAAEIVEHLYLPPSAVFPFFAACLSETGRLVVQTPNAVALAKRLRILTGRHPYMQLRPPRPDPGHVREYTFAELEAAGAGAGLRVERAWVKNYFGYAGLAGRVYNRACDVLPRGLRNAITIVFARS
jgi:hypothetical protein